MSIALAVSLPQIAIDHCMKKMILEEKEMYGLVLGAHTHAWNV